MKCYVKGCANDSTNINNSRDITFYVFPNEMLLQAPYLKAMGIEILDSKDQSAICSEHVEFDEDINNGLKNFKAGAVSVTLQVCRICLLSSHERMYSLRLNHLKQAYEDLTGVRLEDADRLPQKLCAECAARLVSHSRFRSRSLRAHSVMTDILNKQHYLTEENLANVNRENNYLTSPLKAKHYEANHIDMHIIENDEESKGRETINIKEETVKVEIDNETNLGEEVVKVDKSEPVDEDVNEFDTNRLSDGNESVEEENRETKMDVLRETIIEIKVEEENNIQFSKEWPSEENLANVNRENDHIKSPLKAKHYEANHNDMRITENQGESKGRERRNIKEETAKICIEIISDDDDDDNFDEVDANCLSDDTELEQGEKRKTKMDLLKEKVIKIKVEKKKNVQLSKEQNVPKKRPTKPRVRRCRKELKKKEPKYLCFTVTELSLEDKLKYFEEKQESLVYKNALFRCTDCYRGFTNGDAYKRHTAKHTDQYGVHVCKICKLHFKHNYTLSKHTNENHKHRFSCNECEYVTMAPQSAKQHEGWHNGTKYRCTQCPGEFKKFTTYLSHKRLVHPSDFICELCGCAFVSAKGLQQHKKLKHRFDDPLVPDDGPYCELCDLRFISAMAFERHLHVAAKHNGREISIGNRYDYKSSNFWRKLKDTKGADGPISCEQCGLQMDSRRAYHFHFLRSHPDKNRTVFPISKKACMCEFCGKILQNKSFLKDHRRIHTGERPFICDHCNKAFVSKPKLIFHLQRHTETRVLYPCELCGKKFYSHSNRLRHKYVHSELKTAQCEVCNKMFKTSAEVKNHMNYVHLKKPWPKRNREKRSAEK